MGIGGRKEDVERREKRKEGVCGGEGEGGEKTACQVLPFGKWRKGRRKFVPFSRDKTSCDEEQTRLLFSFCFFFVIPFFKIIFLFFINIH